MSCRCQETMQNELRSRLGDARRHGYALHRRLDEFQKSIRQGANAVACVHLFRAGMYLAARETESPGPSPEQIQNALERELAATDQDLYQFMQRNINEIMGEDYIVDKPKMLLGILKQKAKAFGLLSGRAESEKINARRALERARRIEERLSSWKEGTIRVAITPELIRIADIHGDEPIK